MGNNCLILSSSAKKKLKGFKLPSAKKKEKEKDKEPKDKDVKKDKKVEKDKKKGSDTERKSIDREVPFSTVRIPFSAERHRDIHAHRLVFFKEIIVNKFRIFSTIKVISLFCTMYLDPVSLPPSSLPHQKQEKISPKLLTIPQFPTWRRKGRPLRPSTHS